MSITGSPNLSIVTNALLLVVVCMTTLVQGQTKGRNPCHNDGSIKNNPSTCEKIILPDGFCGACPFGDIDASGFYLDCTQTMKLDADPVSWPTCKAAIQKYVDLNPCDVPRKNALENFNTKTGAAKDTARLQLDFFMYAYCEAPCDCIPYNGADFNNPSSDVYRGNCPAHPFYDICKQSPDIRLILSESQPDQDATPIGKVCPKLTDWINSSDSQGWPTAAKTTYQPPIENVVVPFLENLLIASELETDSAVWSQCFNLESSQSRIVNFVDGTLDPTPSPTSFSGNPLWIDLDEPENYVARNEGGFVQAGDKFYMIGGLHFAKRLDIYDYTTNTWSIGASTSTIDDNIGLNHFQAVEYQGLIWIIGSLISNVFPGGTPASNVYVYDPARDTWNIGRNIPEGRRRGGAGLVVHDGNFFIVAGNTNGHNGGAVKWLDKYNPVENTWSILPDAPHKRDHFSAVLVENKIYCIGGRATDQDDGIGANDLVPEVDVYTFGGFWETLPGVMLPNPRAVPATGLFDGKILIAGGESYLQLPAFREVDAFDPVSQTFTRVASMNHPRHGTQGIVSGGGFYVAGGSPVKGAGNQLNMEVYGSNTPEGTASTVSVLDGPASASIEESSSTDVVISHTGGNTGAFVNSITLTGPDAGLFTLDMSGSASQWNPSLNRFLIPIGASRTVTVHCLSHKANAEAALTVVYGSTGLLTIPLSSRAAPSSVGPLGECWMDVSWNRAMNIKLADMGIASCIESCRNHPNQYPFAAVQYGRECFCGFQYGKHGIASDQTECNMPCNSGPGICGGYNRMNVYSTGLDPSGPFGECWVDVSWNRALEIRLADMGIVPCIESCREHPNNYPFAAVQYGVECFCGSQYTKHGPASDPTECDMECALGRPGVCGGFNRMNVYKTSALPAI